MSETCEVVKIKADNEQGFVIINKSDLKDEADLFVAGENSTSAPKEGSKAWLAKQLEDAGIEFEPGASKADLQALFDALGGN
jgi:hypothetical protein